MMKGNWIRNSAGQYFNLDLFKFIYVSNGDVKAYIEKNEPIFTLEMLNCDKKAQKYIDGLMRYIP